MLIFNVIKYQFNYTHQEWLLHSVKLSEIHICISVA